MKYAKDETDRARAQLLEWLPPGTVVQCVLRHVSRSGMSRSISLFAGTGGELKDLTYRAACVSGDSIDQRHGGIRVGGCGMDMGFHLVYNLARTLYPAGFGCTGARGAMRCPSNDHSNGDSDYTPHACRHPECDCGIQGCGPRNHMHSDGGYALCSRWI